jgi:CRISPR/Cas system-associated exonuclease Cas4 (RecB family)
MRTIRVSEIGSYLYCSRSWWYQRQGIESENQAELVSGTELHRKHGRSVLAAGCVQTLAYGLLLLALVLLTISAVSTFLSPF